MKMIVRILFGLVLCTALVLAAAYLGGGLDSPNMSPQIKATASPIAAQGVPVYRPPVAKSTGESDKDDMKKLKLNP